MIIIIVITDIHVFSIILYYNNNATSILIRIFFLYVVSFTLYIKINVHTLQN